jgi:hypothetical protein
MLLRYKRPQLVHVDGRVPLRVARQVEAAHTDLTKVTRMVFIKVGSEKKKHRICQYLRGIKTDRDIPVVVRTTSKTTTTRMFPMLAYTPMAR